MRKYEAGPDGGWGWMVCLGTFIVAFIIEGTTAAFGVLITPIQEEFDASKSSTTWVASVSFGVCYLIGPITSVCLEKYSLRLVTIAGSLIGFCGFLAAAFSPNIGVLILTYGVIGGIGMGITFMTAIVAVGRYFDKKRAVATGIALSGAGFGMFAYPYLTELILQVFDWRGTVLLMAGIYLNCAVSGTIFRPISVIDSDDKRNNPDVNKNKHSKLKRQLDADIVYHSLPHINCHEVPDVDTCALKANSLECIKNRKSGNIVRYELPRKDICSSGFLQMSLENVGSPITKKDEERNGCISNYGESFQVLKYPTFILVLFAMVFWSVQYICTLYIPDFATSQGMKGAESALLVSFIGITNTVARIITGFIVDFLHVRSITLYLFAFIVVTISTFLLPLCNSYWLIALYCIVSGFCVGTFTGLRTIVIVDFTGIDFLSYAFGWTSFFQGVSSIPVPPLAGFIYDVSGSYSNPFLLVACYYVCGAITCCVLRFSHKCMTNRKELSTEEQQLNK